MDGFFGSIKKYREFILLATKFKLKHNLQSSRIGYIWWVLDPLCFMLIYTLVVVVIFQRNIPNANVFILSSLMPWRWFQQSLNGSCTSVTGRISMIEQVYVPKHILPLVDLCASGFQFLVTLPLIAVIMLISGVVPTWHVIELVPVTAAMAVFMYGLMLILAHVGVYFTDIKNIVNLLLRFMFYLSPIMYDVSGLPEDVAWLWWLNPMTTFGGSFREILYRGGSALYFPLLIWTLAGILFIMIGTRLMAKYDRNYAKMK